ncbi:NAD(P)/FAD-dependent oxidoreductase [Rothia nasimurium]|uniref:Flavin-dependent monooxygenase n=1 Tax=Luteibacter anthropi TaxID=564369 RepID=A0A7X5UAI3_9GAMM|nr:NAD(P)/FAD-dependent oxidoreductase [Luteibacter anthropi]NII06930.1 FAD-dependent monooxygenase [Luteibacter anthropi]
MSNNRHLPSNHLLHGLRIAIVGGGPSGLTLARLLQQQAIDVVVYERDSAADARTQGGSLDLHEDSGQRALAAAGLGEAFQRISRPDGQHSKIFNQQGELCGELKAEDESGSRPEIDRGALRALLLGSLNPGTVRWGHRLISTTRGEGQVQLSFEQTTVGADLVLACDGGWSACRALVSKVTRPTYSGVTFVQTLVADVDHRSPDIATLVGPGNILALGNNRGLLAQRNGDGSVRIYVALRVPEEWSSTIDFSAAQHARKRLLQEFQGWSPLLQEMLKSSDDVFQPWPLYHYPVKQDWIPRSDITLLGDAAHLMPPFTGKGANYAMLDALELTEALTGHHHLSLTEALEQYESAMLTRMETAIAETLHSQNAMFTEDGPDTLIDALNQAG